MLHYSTICFLMILALPSSAHEPSITGKVTVDTMVELEGAVVTLLQNQQKGTQVVTDEMGDFQFSEVAPGDYHIFIFMPGYESFDQPLQVVAGEPARLKIHLKSRDEICYYPIYGTAPPQTGSLKIQVNSMGPLPCVTIELFERGKSWPGPQRQTGLDGEAAFSNIDPGKYEVVATYPGFKPVRAFAKIRKRQESSLTLQMIAP